MAYTFNANNQLDAELFDVFSENLPCCWFSCFNIPAFLPIVTHVHPCDCDAIGTNIVTEEVHSRVMALSEGACKETDTFIVGLYRWQLD